MRWQISLGKKAILAFGAAVLIVTAVLALAAAALHSSTAPDVPLILNAAVEPVKVKT